MGETGPTPHGDETIYRLREEVREHGMSNEAAKAEEKRLVEEQSLKIALNRLGTEADGADPIEPQENGKDEQLKKAA